MLRGILGSAGGPPVGGSGATNTIPRWTGPSTLGDSGLIDNGTAIYTTTRNVGIGTASPASRLHVNDTTTFSTTRNIYTGTITAGLGGSIGLGGYWTGTTETVFALIVGGKDNATSGDYGGHLQFWTRPNGGVHTERARIDSTGNLILNTANTGATIQAAGTGQGLKLPATPGNTDPNTLDCYADGGTANSGGVTWTPELRFGGATTGITYTTRVGRYTRFGNTVIAHCYVILSSKGSATGNVTIAGLPTSSNTSGLFASVTIGYISGVSFTNQMTGYIGPNQTEVSLFETTNAGALSTITDADFTATSGIMFTVSYPVT